MKNNIRAVSVAGVSISSNEDGLYSLNDLHKASGGERKHEPHLWLRSREVKEVIEEMEKSDTHICVTKRGGKDQGTFVDRILLGMYASWISAKFHILVYKVFFEAMDSKIKALEEEKSRLIVQSDNRRRDDLARENIRKCYGFNREVNQAIRLIIAGISMKDKTYLEIVQSKNCMPTVFKEAWGYIERNLVRCVNPEASEFDRIYTLLK